MHKIVAHEFLLNEIRISRYVAPSPRDPFDDDPTEDNNTTVNPAPDPVPAIVADESETSPLDKLFNSAPNSPKPYQAIPKTRAVPFTRRKARNIKQRLSALETIAPPHELVMLTGTLPGSTTDALRTIAELSGQIPKKLQRWIRYHVDAKHWLYTWEFQDRGALHIHYVVHVPDPVARAKLIAGFRQKWIDVLKSFGDEKTLCLFARADGGTWLEDESKVQAQAEEITKSAANYLSKYLAKSKYARDEGSELFYPYYWSRCSTDLITLTESLKTTLRTTDMTTNTATVMMDELKHCLESAEGKVMTYRHAGDLHETVVFYPSTKEEGRLVKEEILTILSSVEDRVKVPVPATPPAFTESQLRWQAHCREQEEIMKRRAAEKVGYLASIRCLQIGRLSVDALKVLNDIANTNDNANYNANRNGNGNARRSEGGFGAVEDRQQTLT